VVEVVVEDGGEVVLGSNPGAGTGGAAFSQALARSTAATAAALHR
jgi:hypothetical protein